ncbi:hypothetical protein SAMN05421776_101615 [Nocardia farcinica]|uniref:DUF8020 domain-containing protein n=1 Tax=Nocardia farcinica TaxID=37329 RepID=A0A0H5NZD4_NOCFR|nr:hypothetical protein [Nocardia farcinica]AXK84792.1 hypothetical protein DXT66_03275 [Nocardia farcinica]MBA4854476.1 hypothetical protein [Nocardia farcinica]MBC9814661.1 hypothetical protein [Nocardia farcinica]CRY75481.1 Uncharacterised protein [Nocardia farcinica]SIS67990.1 hypothetical protein SAMN05421776_101615 [Nocardia farcinica]
MKIKKFTVAAALAIAALGVAENTAVAAPQPSTAEISNVVPRSAQGIEQGVGYLISRDGHTFTAELTGATFEITEESIDIRTGTGIRIASVPRAVQVGEHVLTLAPRVAAGGASLVADVAAQDIGQWRKTSPRQRSIEAGVAIGGGVGAFAGLVVGMVVGIAAGGLLIPISVPIGLLAGLFGGMALGGAAGAAIPNSDVPDQWDYQEECEYIGDYRYCW